jgi:hypothetical protein
VLFGAVGKILRRGFNGIYLVRFWIQNVGEILIFKVIFVTENSNKFPKSHVLEGKIS